MSKSTITDERITSVIERLEHYAYNLKWTNVRGAQDLLTAADGLRELQELRKADSEPVAVREPIAWLNDAYLARGVVDGEAGSEDAGPGYIPVYRHAQQTVVPEDYKLVPTELTSEMVKAFRSFCEAYDDDLIAGYKAMLAAAPQSPGSEPDTVPGKWIPVSELMPLTPSADCEYSDIEVNVFDGERVFTAHYATGSQPQPWAYWVDTYAKITHWQPLPAAPQEDKP